MYLVSALSINFRERNYGHEIEFCASQEQAYREACNLIAGGINEIEPGNSEMRQIIETDHVPSSRHQQLQRLLWQILRHHPQWTYVVEIIDCSTNR